MTTTTPLVGTRERPYRRVPPGFSDDGIPWGAFCQCSECGHVGRSTAMFDYYRDKRGGLRCDACTTGASYYLDVVADREILAGKLECDALGLGCRGGYDESLSEAPPALATKTNRPEAFTFGR